MTDTDPQWLTSDEQRLWRQWMSVGSSINAALARQMQRDTGLSMADYEVMVNLSEAPDHRMRIAALADALQWDRSRLSHQLSRMRNRGLVTRESCGSDGRGAFIVITDDGLTAIRDAAPGHVAAVRTLFVDRLSPHQARNLADTLTLLAEQFTDPVKNPCQASGLSSENRE